MAKYTNKQLRLQHYNAVILKNKSKFKSGKTITRKALVKLFNLQNIVHVGTAKAIQRSNLDLVHAQVEINMLMRENGLYLKSSDYYSRFTIMDKDKTKETVKRFSTEVEVYGACTSRLINSIEKRTKKGDWGTYKSVTNSTINTFDTLTPSDRHTDTMKKLKKIV